MDNRYGEIPFTKFNGSHDQAIKLRNAAKAKGITITVFHACSGEVLINQSLTQNMATDPYGPTLADQPEEEPVIARPGRAR